MSYQRIIFGVAGAVLFVNMPIAIITRGPWGMIRPYPVSLLSSG